VSAELTAQIARSAATLRPDAHPRLERLRGLGAAFGRVLTCRVARITRASGADTAILVAAIEAAGPRLTIGERARYLIEGNGAAAAFGADGSLLHATAEAAHHISGTASLSDLGDGIETLHVGDGSDALVLAFFPADSDPIKSVPAGAATTAPSGLLDLSPIAEAITAMTKVPPPQRNGHAGKSRDEPQSRSDEINRDSEAAERRHPLRFLWETDAENRFTINSDEFVALAGPRTANLLGRFWGEISAKLALDPEGLVAQALVSRNTWSGIEVSWPTTDGDSISVLLSGIPAFDRDRSFRGYRGMGVWCGEAEEESPAEALQPVKAEPVPQSEPGFVNAVEPLVKAEPDSVIEHQAPVDDLRPAQDAAQSEDRNAAAAEDAPQEEARPREQDMPPQTENVVPFPSAHVDLKADPKAGGLNLA
jgi:hypothetical protein